MGGTWWGRHDTIEPVDLDEMRQREYERLAAERDREKEATR